MEIFLGIVLSVYLEEKKEGKYGGGILTCSEHIVADMRHHGKTIGLLVIRHHQFL
jgi:hypothetical protein